MEVSSEKAWNQIQALEFAIAEAQKGLYFVSPNPSVGCVILDRHNKLLSSGFHEKFGGPHAEASAIDKVKDKALLEGATLVVTLEPCAHRGKTGSCAELIARYPFKKVIYGLMDPNPKVSGKGEEIIKRSGIEIEKFPESSLSKGIIRKLKVLIEPFKKNLLDRHTYFSLKVASSLDGYMGLKNGESKWITNQLSREFSHKLRAKNDLVLIGKQTFLKDNPNLNVRHGEIKKSVRAGIIDPSGETLRKIEQSNLVLGRDLEEIFLIVSKERCSGLKSSNKISILFCPENESGEIQLDSLRSMFYEREIYNVFVEGGSHTLSQFIKQRVCDRFYLFLAPLLIGEISGMSWNHQIRLMSLADSRKLELNETKVLDQDLFMDYSF